MDIEAWWGSVVLWWIDAGWPWLSGWMQSAGFAGTAAVVAAIIAFASARAQKRRDSWWETLRWSVDLAVDTPVSDPRQGVLGLRVIQALAKSRHVRDDQFNVVRAITDVILDPVGDGTDTDDLAIADVDDPQPEGTYLTQEEVQDDYDPTKQAAS